MGLVNESEETCCDGVPLDDKGSDEEIEAYAAKPVALQKRHQKTKTNKDHHVDILEHCRNKRERVKKETVPIRKEKEKKDHATVHKNPKPQLTPKPQIPRFWR